jgi:hypothetical protein
MNRMPAAEISPPPDRAGLPHKSDPVTTLHLADELNLDPSGNKHGNASADNHYTDGCQKQADDFGYGF